MLHTLSMSALDKLKLWQIKNTEPGDMRPMPPDVYTCPEVHSIEIENIFKREWICVGHVSEFENVGDYRTMDIATHPVIIVQTSTDNIKTYSNVCPHRSSRLLGGSGNINLIICPYHAWAYSLDGKLKGAPYMDKDNPPKVCLNELKSEIWNGLIFVNLDPGARPLAPRLESLNDAFTAMGLAGKQVVHSYDGDVGANWKVLVENFCESYHVFRVHKTTLESDTPTATTEVLPSGEGFNYHTMGIVAGKHHRGDEIEQKEHLAGIYPSTTVATSENWAIWLSIIPNGHDKLKFRTWIARKLADGESATLSDEELENILAFMAEDKAINEGVQLGLVTGVGNQGPLHPFERTNWDFGHYYANVMLD